MLKVKNYKIHKISVFFVLFFFVIVSFAGPLSYAAPPEGKGNAGGNGNGNAGGNGNGNAGGNGNGNGADNGKALGQEKQAERATQAQEKSTPASERKSESVSRGNSADAKVERQHPHQDRNNIDISDRGSSSRGDNGRTKLAMTGSVGVHGKSGDHAVKGRDMAKGHLDNLLKSLNKFEHAKWDQNPKDSRGQGNMGKPNMRAPYGFDKDSGREGSERGRPIRERVLDLAALISNFQVTDPYLTYLQNLINFYRSYGTRYAWLVSIYQNYLNYYITTVSPRLTYYQLAVNRTDTLQYSFNLGTQEGFEGTTLLVTTSLVSLNTYDSSYYNYVYNPVTRRWEATRVTIHYDAGQTVMSQTQEATIGEDTTVAFSYDLPTTLAGYNGGYFELQVTLTDPESGATYTFAYDKDFYLYRCPYGIVYDKKTGKAIAGAVVTVHNADGSVAVLDKGANPNVSNPQTTDATGRYNCKLAIGKKYYLTVKTPGYQEYKSDLFSERWHIVREDVGMNALQVMAGK